MVDFDDLLYLAVKDGISLPKFDFIFVDEAQDTNAIQRALLRKIMRKGSRIVAVGDPAQAIYGFRGADSESLNLIAEEFDAIKLPLSISYRCSTSVVSYAQQWVSHIQAAPGAKAGEVQELGTKWDTST
ncbi:UvrD-helicase domain-containing protein, partial [Citrobacter sp. ku-bf4]|uniref:UvrD-helicase domain-containing protein n=1 Tax=Citrobacter sp. ku-bf4 TaxID=2814654 RepID=UPI00197DABEA|nr:UvrD-helicase domain-containing protein [Citrobacter sp. ku-bf4]